MPQKTRIEIAKRDIVSFFESLERRAFTTREISAILARNREFWRLAQSTSTRGFISFLESHARLKRTTLTTPTGTSLDRFTWGEASPYALALSLRSGSYLCHGTAVFLHGLTDLIPKTIYVNHEQTPKPSGGTLTQHSLDLAFSRQQRTSNYIFSFDHARAILVSGKYTGRLEVGTIQGPSGESIDATKLERTLIDIVVRPAYAGGIIQVLEAYKSAQGRASTNTLRSTLKRLEYVYPYHQAIGFLMERAGYPRSRAEKLRELGLDFDFYLVHGMKDPLYDKRWRLFYPAGL